MSKTEQDLRANVSEQVQPLVDELVSNAAKYRVAVSHTDDGVRMVDAGIDVPGGLAAGRLIGEICMGGLGAVHLAAADRQKRWWWHVDVHSGDPVTACLASQYAGWSLNHGEGKEAFYALGSGPARGILDEGPAGGVEEHAGLRTIAFVSCRDLDGGRDGDRSPRRRRRSAGRRRGRGDRQRGERRREDRDGNRRPKPEDNQKNEK